MRFPVVLTACLIKLLTDNHHIISAAIIDDTHNVIAIAGDTVRLNCTGGKQWRGPDVKKGTIPYFDLYSINPAVTIRNIKLEVSRGQYDLVISNISKENIGLYACQSFDTSLMISIKKYRVSLIYVKSEKDLYAVVTNWTLPLNCTGIYRMEYSTTEEYSTTTGYKVNNKTKRHIKLFVVVPASFAGLLIFVICFTLMRFYQKKRRTQNTSPPVEHVQYDEIGPIDNNPVYPDVVSRPRSSTSPVTTNGSSRSSSRMSVLIAETNEYENTYQTLIHEHVVENPYTNCNSVLPLMATGEALFGEPNEDRKDSSFSSLPMAMEHLENVDLDDFMKLVNMVVSSSSSSQVSSLVGETDGYENPYQLLSQEQNTGHIYTNYKYESIPLPNDSEVKCADFLENNVENFISDIGKDNNINDTSSNHQDFLGEGDLPGDLYETTHLSIHPFISILSSVESPVQDSAPVFEDDRIDPQEEQFD